MFLRPLRILPFITLLTAAKLLGETPAKAPAAAGEKASLTFFVSGIECGACVEVVKQSVEFVKGVSQVQVEQRLDSVANVTFDPARVKPHDIALAVRDAVRLHGLPYEASLRLRIPACIQPENRAGIESRLAGLSPHLKFHLVDPDLGEYAADLSVPEEGKPVPAGWWNLRQLDEALRAESPAGLGLKFQWVHEEI